MRCECCDRILSDSEATAKFVETDGTRPHRFVGMCRKCQREAFGGTNVRVVVRSDLETEDTPPDDLELGEYDGEEDSD